MYFCTCMRVFCALSRDRRSRTTYMVFSGPVRNPVASGCTLLLRGGTGFLRFAKAITRVRGFLVCVCLWCQYVLSWAYVLFAVGVPLPDAVGAVRRPQRSS